MILFVKRQTCKYNDKKIQIEELYYNNNGEVDTIFSYQYNDKGKLISEVRKFSRKTYKYDDRGNEIEELYYSIIDRSLKQALIEKNIHQYDDKGNLIEETSYNRDGSIRFKYTCKYDEFGNEIEHIEYDKNNKPYKKTEYLYSK